MLGVGTGLTTAAAGQAQILPLRIITPFTLITPATRIAGS